MRRNRPGKNLPTNSQAGRGASLPPLLSGPSAEPGKATLFGGGGSSRLGLRRVRILPTEHARARSSNEGAKTLAKGSLFVRLLLGTVAISKIMRAEFQAWSETEKKANARRFAHPEARFISSFDNDVAVFCDKARLA